jgi:hypothetical protein
MEEGLIEGVKYETKWRRVDRRSKARREMAEGLIDGGKVRREMAEGLMEGVKYEGKWGEGVSSADQ